MRDFYHLLRFKLGEWMLRRSLDVIPRCEFRDDLRLSIVHVYADHNNCDS